MASVNYALVVNHFQPLLKLTISNEGEEFWRSITIEINGGEHFESKKVDIASLQPGTKIDATQELVLNALNYDDFKCSEPKSLILKLIVNIDSNVSVDKEFEIRIMPSDYWMGTESKPEILAAYVNNDNNEIYGLIKEAKASANDIDIFDQYQSQNKDVAYKIVENVYNALQHLKLTYDSEPVNFKTTGSRIDSLSQILDSHTASAIDLATSYAALIESIGLRPLLVIFEDRILTGAWLVKGMYDKAVGEDISLLKRDIENGDVLLFDPICATNQDLGLQDAIASAAKVLQDESEFDCFIDIMQSRRLGIRPISPANNANSHVDDINPIDNSIGDDRYDIAISANDKVKLTKYMLWERKLLDLTLRNNLLNMRMGKKIIPLISFNIARLEDLLQSGQNMQILPFPYDSTPTPTEDGMFDSSAYQHLKPIIVSDLNLRKLHSFRPETELKNSLKYIYRSSRTSIEENGASNLYMAVGVLKWYETERSQQARYAPLILVPVEVVRGAVTSGYVIRTRDEETTLNITLVELLKQQYSINLSHLAELPKDDSGVDVPLILNEISRHISIYKGWEVVYEAMIGLFSFSKFVMWNDIHTNSAKLQRNHIISSLVDGVLNISEAQDMIDARHVDANITPAEFILPIDVDSSQLEAVIESGEGKSFILHGPPGTGKSQTITNMIANAMYHGKRVLFVAEKMAALSVVQSRLEKIGLSPFCLELHSNKATKQHFLQQLEQALNAAGGKSQNDFEAEAEQLFKERKSLINTIEALHAKRQPLDMSLYDCIEEYLRIPGAPIKVDISRFGNINRKDIEEYIDKLAKTDTIFKIIGYPCKSPLNGLNIVEFTAEAEDTIRKGLKDIIYNLQRWEAEKQMFEQTWGISLKDSLDNLKPLNTFLQMLRNLRFYTRNLLLLSEDQGRIIAIDSMLKVGKEASDMSMSLANDYRPEILDFSSSRLEQEWNDACGKWFIFSWFARKVIIKRMRLYKPDFKETDIYDLIDRLKQIESKRSLYQLHQIQIQTLFAHLATASQEQWEAMTDALRHLSTFGDAMAQLSSATDMDYALVKEAVINHMPREWGREQASRVQDLEKIIAILLDLQTSLQEFKSVVDINIPQKDWNTSFLPKLETWSNNEDQLRDWMLWRMIEKWLQDYGQQNVLTYLLDDKHTPTETTQAFAKGLYASIANDILSHDSNLRLFKGMVFEDCIEKYRKLTAKFQDLSKRELYCKLASKVPTLTMRASDASEMGILKRYISNKGRGASIRKIVDNIPNLMSKLCPCILMSPISVAQYVDLDRDLFDIVIFDEASQMPTCEAVGAIARGKSLVVVGDPKQMPPTSFFATSQVGEDEIDLDDLESILDDCISISLPSKYLTWHYRSKHESLISFSNAQYYDGKLLTFPSIDDSVSRVSMHSINGTYDKGKTRSNLTEAIAVVDEVIRRLSDPIASKYSIGIVSFSKVQQDIIEDLLTDQLSRNPHLEAIAYGGKEPIFIKNLENVQGDERDVILFSIGYGPDSNGKVSMNFGPLNNAGGERRLNVAVSRARYEMMVFSSMKSDQIDLRRSSSLGVLGLKNFLEYAESGKTPIPANQANGGLSSCIAPLIAAEIEKAGYKTVLNVGRSKFKIDIAVVDSKNPQKYILGILSDGPGYYETKTMRDREIVRPSVLKSLCWEVTRVWTLDWYQNPKLVIDTIINKLQSIENKLASGLDYDDEPTLDSQNEIARSNESERRDNELVDRSTHDESTIYGVPYTEASFTQSRQLSGIEEMEVHSSAILTHMQVIINEEQPVLKSYLYKRITKAWGIPRLTPRLQSFLDKLIQRVDAYHEQEDLEDRIVYWRGSYAKDMYKGYRTASNRTIQDVPLIEMKNAMAHVLDQLIAIDLEELNKSVAQELGFVRSGTQIDLYMTKVLSKLVSENYIQLIDGKAVKS